MYEHAIHASRKRMLAEVAVAHAREELAVKEHAAKKARMLYRATLPQLVVRGVSHCVVARSKGKAPCDRSNTLHGRQ